jgi:hypothetical protein
MPYYHYDFKIYYPGTPEHIYNRLLQHQKDEIEYVLNKIKCIYPSKMNYTAYDLLNEKEHRKLFEHSDIGPIIISLVNGLVIYKKQSEYQRLGKINVDRISDNGPNDLQMSELPLYIQSRLHDQVAEDNKRYPHCDVFGTDSRKLDEYPNIQRKNVIWTPEQILQNHHNCGIITDVRDGFHNVTYALGCCYRCMCHLKYCRMDLRRLIIEYNNSYDAKFIGKCSMPYVNVSDFFGDGVTKLCDKQTGKLNTSLIPMVIMQYLNDAAHIIENNCICERINQYNSYEQHNITAVEILMNANDIGCATIYDRCDNESYKQLCGKCKLGHKLAREYLYDLIIEYNMIMLSNIYLDNVTHKLISTILDHKLKELELDL